MPVVAMPDGSKVNMPDNPTPEQISRLRAVQAKQSLQSTETPGRTEQVKRYTGKDSKIISRWNPEPDVDFDTGVTMIDHMALAQADNQEEKLKYLRKVYGGQNVKITSKGTIVVLKDGKQVAIDGGNKFTNFVGDILGKSPTLAGMGVGAGEGAAIGAPAGPWGIALGTVGGAAIGAMGGKTIEDLTKMATGRYAKDIDQYAKAVVKAGVEGAEGEVGGEVTTDAISRVLRGRVPGFIGEQTPETNAMTEKVLAGGGRPNIAKVTPGLKHFNWMQTYSQKVSGRTTSQDAANELYIAKRIRSALLKSGVPPDHVDGLIKELASDDSIPTAEAGEHVSKAVQAHREMLEESTKARMAEAQTLLDRNISQLDKLTQRFATGDLGVDVSKAITTAHKDFDTGMAKVFSRVDSMVGETPLVPTTGIRQVAEDINRRMLKTSQAGATKELSQLGKPTAGPTADQLLAELGVEIPAEASTKMSFADAQRIRMQLREMSESRGLVKNIRQQDMDRLLQSVDHAIESSMSDPAAAPAAKLLQEADAMYRKGVQRFNDATIKRLVRDTEAGLPPDPTEVARRIVQPGYSARVGEIRKIVGPDVWKRVSAADYDNMITAATDSTGKISGLKLLQEVTNRGKLMEELHGPNADKIRELAKAVAARDGSLTADQLAPGALQDSIKALRAAETAENDFMKKNALSILADPKKNPEEVYRWLVKPDNASGLKAAVKLLGPDSPQIKSVQQAAMRELLTQAKTLASSDMKSEALTTALSKYTAEQKKLLFPNGLDEDLGLLGKEIQFLMKPIKDEAMAGFAAGATLGALPLVVRIPTQIGAGIYANILSRPTTIRYLALGLRSESGPVRKAAKESIKDLVRYGAVGPDESDDK